MECPFHLGETGNKKVPKCITSGKGCRENGVSTVRKLVLVKMGQAGSDVEVGVQRAGPSEKVTSEPIPEGVCHVSSYWKSFPGRGNSKCKSLGVFKEEALQGDQREEHRGGEVRNPEGPRGPLQGSWP